MNNRSQKMLSFILAFDHLFKKVTGSQSVICG